MTAESLRALPAKTILVASLAACFTLTAGSALAQTATETELARKLDQLAAELAAVKAQLTQIQQQRSAATPAAEPALPAAAAAAPGAPAAESAPKLAVLAQ